MVRSFMVAPLGLLFAWAGPWTCAQYTSPDGGSTSSVNPTPGAAPGSGGQTGTISQTVDAGFTGTCSGTLAISPPNPVLDVSVTVGADGGNAPATVQLTALCTTASGTTPVTASWFSQRPNLATVGYQTGLLSSGGPMGGQVGIVAGAGGVVANATVTVVVTQTVYAGAPANASSYFQAAPLLGSAAAPSVLYPNAQTVIPVNLPPLDFQWEPGAANDLFQVSLTGTYAKLVAYVAPPYTAPPANSLEPSWQPDPTVWSHFAQSNIGEAVALAVAGASSGAPGISYGSASQSLTLARSRMAGEMYYWAVRVGRIFRVPAGATTPPTDIYNNQGCIACHAVSSDGTKLSAELWGGGQPGTVLDLSSNPVTPIVNVGPSWDFSTFDPTGQNLVVSNGGDLTLRSSATAQPVPAGTGEGNLASVGCGPGSTCTQPSWSRDGKLLVFIKGVPGFFNSDWDFSRGDLLVLKWLGGSSFSGPTVLAAHDYDGRPLANVYPTVSVDDSLVAFTRSPCSYGSNCPDSSALELVPAAGGTPVELAQAEGGDRSSRFPSFSPFKEGGYHWMALFSQRNYGWVTMGSNLRQIWITAVDDNASPLQDSSHPAFWFPGQDPTTENDKAQWATLPCVGSGQACQGDIDCCSPLVCGGGANGAPTTCMTSAQACAFTWSFNEVFQGNGGTPELTLWDSLAFTYQPDPLPATDDIAVSVKVANQQADLAAATPVPICDVQTPPGCANPTSLASFQLQGAYLEVDFTFQNTSCSAPAAGQIPTVLTVSATQTDPGN